MEDFAEQCERFEELHGDEFAAWELPAMKLHFAKTYQRLVGVYPCKRHQLRAELEQHLGEQTAGLVPDVETDGGTHALSGAEVFP